MSGTTEVIKGQTEFRYYGIPYRGVNIVSYRYGAQCIVVSYVLFGKLLNIGMYHMRILILRFMGKGLKINLFIYHNHFDKDSNAYFSNV